jgi:hypothetical protein
MRRLPIEMLGGFGAGLPERDSSIVEIDKVGLVFLD